MIQKAYLSLIILSAVLGFTAFQSSAEPLPGIKYVTLMIHGQAVDFPIANKDYESKAYYLQKALEGDDAARRIILGQKDQEAIYIGDLSKRTWLFVTKDDMYIREV